MADLDSLSSVPNLDASISVSAGEVTFNGYEILSTLGRGGMGVVYRARDPKLNRQIALKLLPSSIFASAGERARFQQEAKAAAAIDHPNIIPVYEIGEVEGQPFLVMRLIEGKSLSECEAEFRGHLQKTAQLIATVARAVQAAHGKGILHRDLKPSNILVDAKTGEPHVADFGIAKILDEDGAPGLTLTGEVLGTPEYMSPEQANGERLSQAADVYSLGAVLYQLLTGNLPIQGKTAADTLRKIAEEVPNRPQFAGGKHDLDLEAITMKCLEKNPAHRYDSAAALADDLESWLRHEPIRARNLTRTQRLGRWARRKPVHATAVGLASAFLLTLAIGGPLVALNQKRLTKAALAAENNANTERGKAERTAAELRRSLYNVEMRVASQAAHEPGGLAIVENLTSKWAGAEDLIGWEWRHFRSQLDQPFEILATSSPTQNSELAISSDGRLFATKLTARGPVSLLDAATGERILDFQVTSNWNATILEFFPDNAKILIGAQHPLHFGVFSVEDGRKLHGGSGQREANEMTLTPDGSLLIQATRRRTRILQASDGKVLADEPHGANPTSLALNPADSSEFLSAGWQGTVIHGRFDPASRSLDLKEFPAAGIDTAVWEVDWSPDGGHVALINTPDYSVSVLDGENFEPVWISGSSSAPLHAASYSVDGRFLAVSGEDRAIRIYEAGSGILVSTLRGHSGNVYQIAWHPDGTKLYSCSQDETLRVWDVSRIGEALALPNRNFEIYSLVWEPQGQVLLACNGLHANAWRLQPEVDEKPAFSLGYLKGAEVSVHPDGDRVAAATEGHLRIFSMENGRELGSFDLLKDSFFENWKNLSRIRWSPDGAWIALSRNYSNLVYLLPENLGRPGPKFSALSVSKFGASWCWAPDSSAIISIRNRTQLLRTPLDGEPEQLLAKTTDTILDLAFDPKGRWLALTGENVIELRDVENFELQKTMIGHSSNIHQVAWAPDGRRLASLEQSGVIGIWDPDTGEAVAMLESPNGERITAIAWSPDGQTLAAGDATAVTHLLEGNVKRTSVR